MRSTALALLLATVLQPVMAVDFNVNAAIDSSQFESREGESEWITRGLLEVSLSGKREGLGYFISAQAFEGDNASESIGDIQVASNIDAEEFAELYEYWLIYDLSSLGGLVTVGQIDLNNQFGYVDNASEFLNSSMGISPTVFAIPTYPEPALSVIYEQGVTSDFVIAGAVSAGAGNDDFSDIFYMLEGRYQFSAAQLKVGGWHHTGELTTLAGDINDGSEGWYAVLEGQSASLPLNYYAQYGYTDNTLSEITQHIGAGITASHFLFNQKARIGLGLTAVQLSSLIDTPKRWEQVAELFVAFELNDTITVQPDIQYILSPAGDDRDVWVSTLRFSLSF